MTTLKLINSLWLPTLLLLLVVPIFAQPQPWTLHQLGKQKLSGIPEAEIIRKAEQHGLQISQNIDIFQQLSRLGFSPNAAHQLAAIARRNHHHPQAVIPRGIPDLSGAKPRQIKVKLTYDVKPPTALPPCHITLAPIANPQAVRIVTDGDMVQPGVYLLRITRPAYEPISTEQIVLPVAAPLLLENKLIAKPVPIRIRLIYDIEPPPHLNSYQLWLINKRTLIPRLVGDGQRIKPGSYWLDIRQPGYSFGPRQEIEILPSEQPYHITKKLIAKPQRLFQIFDQRTGSLASVQQILINGKPIQVKQNIAPGSVVELVVKFARYKTIRKRVKVIPGQEWFDGNVQLVPLRKYDFSVTNPYRIIDGINYHYQFYADSEPIENHLVKRQKGIDRTYFQLLVDPQDTNLKVYAGYLFAQYPFTMLQSDIDDLNRIDVARLIDHLERKSTQDAGHR